MPRPATTRIGPASAMASATSATARPACSIKAKPLVPLSIVSLVGSLHFFDCQNVHADYLFGSPHPEATSLPIICPFAYFVIWRFQDDLINDGDLSN